MVNLYRLVRLVFPWVGIVLCLLALFCPPEARAAFPATNTTPQGSCQLVGGCLEYMVRDWTSITQDKFPRATKQESCDATVASQTARQPGSSNLPFTVVDYSTCTYKSNNNTYFNNWGYSTRTVFYVAPTYSCPSNSTLSGSTCTCNSGWSQSGSSCVDANVDKCANAKDGVDLFTGFSNLPTFGGSFCPSDGAASGCAAKVSGGFCTIKNGVKKCTHEVTYTGDTCVPPAPSPTESPVPTPCKGTYGQVNGVDVCLPLGTDPGVTVETGKKTETATTPSGGGGSTTESTTEKATCIGSQCTTEKTTTTTTPDGVATTKTETKKESKDDYCKSNPRSPQCLTSQYTGAACGAQPSCDGDAIQCAVAAFTFKTQCALTTAPTANPELDQYTIEAAKPQGDQTAGITSTVNLGPTAFDQSNPLGAAAGLSDVTVTVWQTPVTLPLSSVNPWLERIGMVFQAVTFLLCARIVLRG